LELFDYLSDQKDCYLLKKNKEKMLSF